MAEEQKPTAENMTMLQGFEWYVPADQKHWVRLEKHVPDLKKWGVDNIWIPPAYVTRMVQAPQSDKYADAKVLPQPGMDMTSMICTTWASLTRREASQPSGVPRKSS
jgi:hypothetical protein